MEKAPKYASSSRPWETVDGGGRSKDDLRNRGGEVQCGSMPLVGWSDASFEPVDARKVPIGLCDRLNVVDIDGSVLCFAVDIQVYPEAWVVRFTR